MVQLSSRSIFSVANYKAKQKATVRWLISKAYAHQVPEELKDPFYRDSENQELVKAPVVHALANAELYCLALAFIYADPNYSQLNHGQVIQALARKGVHVIQPPDANLTETTLIHTSPLRMSAHMAVMEALMTLYVREIVSPQRIITSVRRVGDKPLSTVDAHPPKDPEEALLLWINSVCAALKRRLVKEKKKKSTGVIPEFPAVRELADLTDGQCLLGLMDFYHPDSVNWSCVALGDSLSTPDCLHNIQQLQNVMKEYLTYEVFHLNPEDLVYFQNTIRQNVLAFLADLFVVLELHPSKTNRSPNSTAERIVSSTEGVKYAGLRRHGSLQERDRHRRSNVQEASPFYSTLPRREIEKNDSPSEDFVVHRVKTVPTLVNVSDTKAAATVQRPTSQEEVPAGVPSNWVERKHSFSGRRSRKNSSGDDSHLTVENFGGSQDNLSFVGRNPDKETVALLHSGKRSLTETPTRETSSRTQTPVAGLSSTGSLGRNQRLTSRDNSLNYINQSESSSSAAEDFDRRSRASTPGSGSANNLRRHPIASITNRENASESRDDLHLNSTRATSFAELSKSRESRDSSSINIVYMQPEKEPISRASRKAKCFSVIETSSWDPQPVKSGEVEITELFQARLKMEEARKRIEADKIKQELVASSQREEVGKQAFLQAMNRGKPLKTSVDTPVSVKSVRSDPSEYNAFQKTHKNSSFDAYRSSPTPGTEQLYPQSASPSRRTWGQPQALPAPFISPQESVFAPTPMRRAQWGTPQPVRPFIGHYPGDPAPYPNSYVNQAYVLQTMGQDPYNSYMVDRNQYVDVADPYYYNQGRAYPVQQQQQQQQQKQYTAPPAAYTPQYGQSPNQTASSGTAPAPFRLHTEPSLDKSPVQTSWVQQQQQQQSRRSEVEDSRQESPQVTLRRQRDTRSSAGRESPMNTVSLARIGVSPTSTLNRSPLRGTKTSGVSDGGGSAPPTLHSIVPTPSLDDMEPQSVSFIETPEGVDRADPPARPSRELNITSGTRTYRIGYDSRGSPPKPSVFRTFQHSLDYSSMPRSLSPTLMDRSDLENEPGVDVKTEKLKDDVDSEKGFVITFEDVGGPKKPKPQLGSRRSISSPKKSESPVLHTSRSYDTEEQSPRRSVNSGPLSSDQSPLRTESRDSGYERSSQDEMKAQNNRVSHNGRSQDHYGTPTGLGLVIGDQLQNPDPTAADEMERKKEKILLLSLRRKEQHEEMRLLKEKEAQQRREEERRKEEEKQRKKEEEKNRKAAILEQFKHKKAVDESDKDVRGDVSETVSSRPKMRNKPAGVPSQNRPRPKTIHFDAAELSKTTALLVSKGKRGSGFDLTDSNTDLRRDGSLLRRQGSSASLQGESSKTSRYSRPMEQGHSGRRDTSGTRYGRSTRSIQNSREDLFGGSNTSLNDDYYDGYRGQSLVHSGRKVSTLSGGPGSLPAGLVSKRRTFDDGSSDVSSNYSNNAADYSGLRLYKQPAARSNRSIMLNAVEYCVFPGAVNKEAKQRVLEEINRSESKNFLILFRDAACQFRALYSYCPERDEIVKLYGTGPKQINETMFDKFFKYNSGGKCFSQVYTKHLTVTIDAFTIHPSLWQGKRSVVPQRKDAPLVL